MGNRPARPVLQPGPCVDQGRPIRRRQGACRQGRPPTVQGLSIISRSRRTPLAAYVDRQRHRECDQKRVGLSGHLLRSLSRRRREVRPGRARERDQIRLVSAANARQRELRRGLVCWRFSVGTCATRSNIICSPTFPAIDCPKSRGMCGNCATSTTCPTPPGRYPVNTCSRSARFSSSRFPIGQKLRRSSRDAPAEKACAARSSGARCPRRSPW